MNGPEGRHSALILVGASAGGVAAVQEILSQIREEMQEPIIVVQHLSRSTKRDLASIYETLDARPVIEAEDKMPIERGRVYFATPEYHLLLERDFSFALSQDEPVHFSRPSIDVCFSSAAELFGPRVVGILLTGANRDGANGMLAIKNNGGFTIVQDPSDAEVDVMPASAIALFEPNRVMKVKEMANFLNQPHLYFSQEIS